MKKRTATLALFATLATAFLVGFSTARAQELSSMDFTATARSETVEPGQTVSVDIAVGGFTNAATFQYTIAWDTSLLNVTGVENPGTLEGFAGSNYAFPQDGKMTFSWDDPTPDEEPAEPFPPGDGISEGETLPNGTTILTINFEVVGAAGSTASVAFNGDVTPIEVTKFNLEDNFPVEVAFEGTDAGIDIEAANTPPNVTNPGAQSSTEGDAVSLPIQASDADVDPLTYVATGLPPGLSIDAAGTIAGTVAGGAASGSPYNAVVTVSDGTEATAVSFEWMVSAAAQPGLSVSPAQLSFGSLTVGTSTTETVTVTSTGDAALEISDVSLSGDAGFTQTNDCPATLPSASDCAVIVTFVPGSAGAASGILSVSSNAGTEDVSLSGTGETAASPVTFTAGSADVSAGGDVTVSVTVSGFTDVTGAQFTLTWDPSQLTFVGAGGYGLLGFGESVIGTPGEGEIGPGQLTVAWDDPEAVGKDLADDATLFEITFAAADDGEQTAALTFADDPTSRKVFADFTEVPFQSEDGTIEIKAEVGLSGAVTYYDGLPVADAALTLSGETSRSTTSDTDGTFALSVPLGGSYTLAAAKADAPEVPASGVNTNDLTLIRRHVLGLQPLGSPYKVIAADADGTHDVAVNDISTTRRLVTGALTTLPGGVWRCLPSGQSFDDPADPFPFASERAYTDVTGPLVDQNFFCFQRGDVDGSWTGGETPALLASAVSTPTAITRATGAMQQPVTFRALDAAGESGSQIVVPIEVAGFTDVNGVQFTMSWDPDVLELASTENYNLNGLVRGFFNYPDQDPNDRVEPGQFTLAWDDPEGNTETLDDGTTIFTATFNAIGDNGTATPVAFTSEVTRRAVFVNFSEEEFIPDDAVVTVQSEVIPVELTTFDAAVEEHDVVLTWQTATETNNHGFEIRTRRKGDGEEAWREAAFVEGAGTTSEPQRYERRLTDLAPGTHVFRLVQIDRDNTRTPQGQQVEATVTVDNYELAPPGPNPFRSRARLTLTVAMAQDVVVEVYDVLGRRVATLHDGPMSANTPRTLTLEGADLASGHYFVRATGKTFADTRSVVLVK